MKESGAQTGNEVRAVGFQEVQHIRRVVCDSEGEVMDKLRKASPCGLPTGVVEHGCHELHLQVLDAHTEVLVVALASS
jgi:hypothetical protein